MLACLSDVIFIVKLGVRIGACLLAYLRDVSIDLGVMVNEIKIYKSLS